MSARWQQAGCGTFAGSPQLTWQAVSLSCGGRFFRQPETEQEMVDSLSASNGQAGRYLENTPEHPYIPYDAPSVRGRAHISSRSGRDDTSPAWSAGAISDIIREHPIPFVMFAASAGILLAAWMGYRRYGVPGGIHGTGTSRSGQTSVGWAMPDGSVSHSDVISGEAADTLGQTGRENPPPLRTQANPPVFDRP
jgi:hypothetical protein